MWHKKEPFLININTYLAYYIPPIFSFLAIYLGCAKCIQWICVHGPRDQLANRPWKEQLGWVIPPLFNMDLHTRPFDSPGPQAGWSHEAINEQAERKKEKEPWSSDALGLKNSTSCAHTSSIGSRPCNPYLLHGIPNRRRTIERAIRKRFAWFFHSIERLYRGWTYWVGSMFEQVKKGLEGM